MKRPRPADSRLAAPVEMEEVGSFTRDDDGKLIVQLDEDASR